MMATAFAILAMFGLDMVFKLSFVRHYEITFFTVISCVIMPCSSMNLNDGLGCRLIITLWALEFHIFVYDIWGFASLLPCNHHKKHWNFAHSCFACEWILRLPLAVALYSHFEHWNFKCSCFACVWSLRVCFLVAS